MRLKYVPRGSWQPNVHNMNRKRATQGRTEPQLRYHVQRCAMMCHALQSQVPPVCRSGYLLVVFGEVSEKSQNLRWCRPWHGLDTALMSCELVLKRWNKKNPRITSIVPGFGAHTCRLVTEKRSESVWIFDDFCTASIALNHWTFGLPFGLPLDYISESSCAHFVKQNDENLGHPKALTKTSGTCSLESHLTKAKLSFSSSSNYLIHLDTISAFVSQMLRDLRVLEITGYHMMPWWFQGRSTSLQDTNSFHKLNCFYCPSCTVNVESLECCHPWLFTKLLIGDKSRTKQFLPASDRSAGLVTSLAPRWCLVC